MNSQKTASDVIKRETQIVKELTGVLSTNDVTFYDIGWDSRVYSVKNNTYFFKFPRSEKIKGRYTQEIAALKLASTISPDIQVPNVIWEHPDNEYFGYEGVQGVTLDKAIVGLDDVSKQDIGKKLGRFLHEFHSLILPTARNIDIEKEIAQFQEWYKPAVPVLEATFSKTDHNKLERLVHKIWPNELLLLGSEPALCHGDLHLPNLMVSVTGELGIIDFGDVGYYDHSKDFIDLGDSVIFESALSSYGDSGILRQKIAIRQKTISIISLTYYIGKNDESGIDRTIDKIRTIIADRH